MKSPYINGSKVAVKGGSDQSITLDFNRNKHVNDGNRAHHKRTKSNCKLKISFRII